MEDRVKEDRKQSGERKTGPLGIAFAVIVALSVTSTAFAGKALYERVRTSHQPPPSTHMAPGSGSLASAGPAAAFSGLRIYSSTAVPPKFVDVDMDGVEDMVTLVSSTTESPDVYATALSGKSLTPIWTRGPYAVQPGSPAHMFLAGDRLVLTRTSETLGNAHVLALRTGGELASYGLTEPFSGACGLVDGSRRLKLASGTVLELDTGTMTNNVQPSPACATEWPKCESSTSKHCVSNEPVAIKGDHIDPGYTYRDDDWQVTVGTLRNSVGLARPTLVVLGSTHGRVVWDEVLSSVESSEEHSVSSTHLGQGRFAILTRESSAQANVRVIDMKTGDDVWQDKIEEAGVTPMSIHTGKSRVFATLVRGGREEVRVYEVDSGKIVGTIADVSSDMKPTTPTPGGYYKGGYYGGYRGTPSVVIGE